MTDDELLAALAEALEPTFVAPSGDSVHALRYLVASQAIAGARAPARGRRWRRAGWLVPATAAATLIAGTGGAYAMTGAELPRPLRSVAAAAGLTDPPAVADARHAASLLTKDLAASHDPATAAVVAKAAQNLIRQLDHLSPTERGKAVPDAKALLDRAGQVVHGPGDTPGDEGHRNASTDQPGGSVGHADDPTTSISAQHGGSVVDHPAASGAKGDPGPSTASGQQGGGHVDPAPSPTKSVTTTTHPAGADQGEGKGGGAPSHPGSPPHSDSTVPSSERLGSGGSGH
jgi:hypothetical protein